LACNLRCRHCGSRAGSPRRDELSTDECLDVVRQLAELGTREVSLIGGEAYLRRDWLVIVKAIADAGMHCGLQTGGRALTEEKIRQAVKAGLRTLGVSIDGPSWVHDRLRGVPGSYDRALEALRAAVRVGLTPGVNTQINALSKPYLREVFDTIVAAGARFWQVQITVPMGNAVDNADILLQPHEVVETVETLADLFERGREVGLRLLPGNNIGYFGPFEHVWRTLTSEPTHWSGCSAGETTLGLEADGKIKGCPSLPAERYSGGLTREVSIKDAVAALAPKTTRRDGNRGRGFCGSCYYWNVCCGGCTWIADALSGKRGDNPYCYYRARELAKKGLRERVVKVQEAPGFSFDTGRFDIVLESADGRRMPDRLARDGKKRPRGRKLVLCRGCREYFFAGETRCPHCHLRNAASAGARDDAAEDLVQNLIGQIERDTQAIYGILGKTPD
ncbi:MAG: radical SAM protein, partial [Alphaproteobacteria bacterium]|nr:radical SAM protein [Alphaproteobacteria bacterium]